MSISLIPKSSIVSTRQQAPARLQSQRIESVLQKIDTPLWKPESSHITGSRENRHLKKSFRESPMFPNTSASYLANMTIRVFEVNALASPLPIHDTPKFHAFTA